MAKHGDIHVRVRCQKASSQRKFLHRYRLLRPEAIRRNRQPSYLIALLQGAALWNDQGIALPN